MNIAEYLPWRQHARIATLERESDKRDRALRKTLYHAQEIERTVASFGVARITDQRYTEIEMHALDARHAAEWVVPALAAVVVGQPEEVSEPGQQPLDPGNSGPLHRADPGSLTSPVVGQPGESPGGGEQA